MSSKITIVDYGIGNLLSVARAIEKCGAQVVLSNNPDEIFRAERLVLPGVGAFSKGMQGLREADLIEPIKEYAIRGRPLLGICLGMQMLFTSSSEFGDHPGLGLIKGHILPISPTDTSGKLMKVPHIGWAALQMPNSAPTWGTSILKGIPPDTHAYFVHSFTANPADEASRLADTYYGDCRISAAVRKDNVSGCQFHPEKSGVAGLRILEAFIESQ